MYQRIPQRQNKDRMQAYAEVVAVFSDHDPRLGVPKATAIALKTVIDANFICKTGNDYKIILYGALLNHNEVPINPDTGKAYILHEIANVKSDSGNRDLLKIKMINKFYHNVRYLLKEYERQQPAACFTSGTIALLKSVAPNDVIWFQQVSRLEEYAKANGYL